MALTLQPDVYRDWGAGVITSLRASELPINASPQGTNSALVSLANGKALVGVRRGATLLNSTTVLDGSSNPVEIRSLFPFYHVQSGSYFRLFTTKDGQLRTLNDDGSTTSISATFLGNDTNPPIWTILNDSAFVANGTNMQKVINKSGTLTPQNIGIVRPVVGSFSAAAGVAGTPNGTYEVVITYSNSTTGFESSRSDPITVTLTNQTLNLSNIPISPDAQVGIRYVYVRNTATQVGYYRIATVNDNTTTSQTGLTWVDSNLTLLSPDAVSNSPPPSTDPFQGVIAHAQRLFGWSGTNLYYSGFNLAEAFDPSAVEPIAPKDGQLIVGCHRINDQVLVIFKERSTYGLYGVDPTTWTVRLIDPAIGLVSPRGVDTVEGITYFWSQLGPIAWNHISAPTQIGFAKIAPDVAPEQINPVQTKRGITIADPPRQRVQFIYASAASTSTCDSQLPFNYRLGCFESNLWQAFDIASAARMKDSAGREYVYMGNYSGKVFKWWTADTDGANVADGAGNAFTLSTTVASAASSTVFTTQSTDNFDATNLVGLYCYLFDASLVTYQRKQIAAVNNTTKTITVATAFGSTPAVGQNVYIATIPFSWDTKDQDAQDPFRMKRLFWTFARGLCSTGATTAYVDVFTNGLTTAPKATFTFPVAASGAVFDSAHFDVDTFAADSISALKARVAKIGYSYRLRIRHFIPNRPFILAMLGQVVHTQNLRSQ